MSPKEEDEVAMQEELTKDAKARQFFKELEDALKGWQRQVTGILKNYAEWLSSLDAAFLDKVICVARRKRFCSEDEIRKVISNYKGHDDYRKADSKVPNTMLGVKAYTMDFHQRTTPEARRILSNPEATVQVKEHNRIVQKPVRAIIKLGPAAISKIISTDHPELGILGPDTKVPKQERSEPAWYRIIDLDIDEKGLVVRSERNGIRVFSRANWTDRELASWKSFAKKLTQELDKL